MCAKSVAKDLAIIVGVIALVAHAVVIADDVIQVVNDPNEQNKPGEILKLAFDLNRYFG